MTNAKKETTTEAKIYLGLRFIFALLLVLIGSICALYKIPDKFFESQVFGALSISPDSKMYENWIEPPLPVYMKFYIFNVTNEEEILNGGKPKIVECGPYVYRMDIIKKNVTFYPNSTVSYYNHYLFNFEPSMSVGPDSDAMYYINVPLAYLNSYLKTSILSFDPFGLANRMVSSLDATNLFSQNTVREMLFGHEDPIFAALSKFGPLLTGKKLEKEFGFFQRYNDSNDGLYLMFTGKEIPDRANQISKWNGNKSLDFWSTKYANMINGSDGSFLGHKLTAHDTPYLFFAQMCRSMMLEYDDDAIVKGIQTIKYHLSDNFFANVSTNPGNAGFCVPSGNCYDSGIMMASTCMEDMPGFLSYPHFYNAAKKYQDAVIGLKPDKESHDSFYYTEPLTGLVIKSQRRFQLNILMQPSYHFAGLEKVRETILPVLWLDASFELRDQDVGDLKLALSISKYIWISSYVILLLGFFVFIAILFCHFKIHRRLVKVTYTKGVVTKSDEETVENGNSFKTTSA